MSDDRPQTGDCLDAETLAAFIDGRLETREREAVEAHLAECEDCYEVWMDGTGLPSQSSPTVTESKTPVWRVWLYRSAWAASVIAVASASALWLRRDVSGELVQDLVAAVGTNRPLEARITGGFQWGELAATRGVESTSIPSPEIRVAEGRLGLLVDAKRSPNALSGFGRARLIVGDTDSAILIFEELLRLAPDNPDARSDSAAAYLERWRKQGTAADAARALSEAEIALQRQPHHVEGLFNKALALEALSLRDAATRAWTAYLEADADSPWAEEARRRIRQMESTPRSPESEAMRLYDEVEEAILPRWSREVLATGVGDVRPLVAVKERLSLSELDRSVIDLVESAIQSGTWPLSRRQSLARAVESLSRWRILYAVGRHADSLAEATSANAALQAAGVQLLDGKISMMLSAYGSGYRAQALSLSKDIELISRRTGAVRPLARVGTIRGILSLEEGAFTDGLNHYNAGAQAAQEAKDVRLWAALEGLLGGALVEQGETSSAWSHIVRSLSKVHEVGTPRARYSILSGAAIAADILGAPGTAFRLADELVLSSQGWDNAGGKTLGYLQRATALATIGNPAAVASDISAAKTALTSIEDPVLREQFLTEVQLAEARTLISVNPLTSIQAFSAALLSLERTSNTYRSTEVLLRRGRGYVLSGDRQSAERDWTRGIDILEQQGATITDARRRIARRHRLADLYGELIALRRNDPLAALTTLERFNARELLSSMTSPAALGLLEGTSIYSWLPERTEALAYSLQGQELLIWHIRRTGVRLTSHQVTHQELGAYVAAARQEGAASRQLSDVLLPRTLHLEDIETLIVVPDGPLHQLPFASLRLADGRFLVEATAPLIAPSLSVLRSLPVAPSRDSTVLLAGDGRVRPANHLPALPFVRQEIEALRTFYGNRATTLYDSDAAPIPLLQAATRAGIVHIASHAIVDRRGVEHSGLLIGSDTPMVADQVRSVRFDGRPIVVLAACDAALGQTSKGEGPMSLARPFLEVGASSVVAALWPISDSHTATLTLELHRSMGSQAVALALAEAQRKFVKLGWPPSKWAALVVIGGLQMGAETDG